MKFQLNYKFKIKIRRNGKFKGKVKPEAEILDGKVFNFRNGWTMDEGIYKGEKTFIVDYGDELDYYLKLGAPLWIARGDLKLLE